jgi:hypothetical protein
MPNAMEKRSTFAATTVAKSFCPHLPVPRRRASLDAAVDNKCQRQSAPEVAAEAGAHQEIVLPTARHFQAVYPQITGKYCLKCSFNLTFPQQSQGQPGWASLFHYGINLGPVVLACENFRSGLLWRLTRRCPYFVTGLRRAGFTNGWLSGDRTMSDR